MKELLALNIYFKRYAGKMLFGVFCIVLSNMVGVYVAVFVREGLNEAVVHSRTASGLGGEALIGIVYASAAGFVVLLLLAAALKGVFMYLMRQSIVVVSRKVEFDLKNDIYNQYQRLGVSFYRAHFTGDMMARIGEDVSNVRMYVGPAVMYFANIIFTFITVITQMMMVNTELTLWVLIPLPLLSYSIYHVSKIINRRNADIQSQLSVLTTASQETFAGIRVIKSFGSERSFFEDFSAKTEEYRRLNMRLAVVNSLFFPLMILLVGISTLMVLFLGGKAVEAGTFSAGNIAEFILYLNMLIWPVASLGWTTALVQKAAASQKRINEFLDYPVEVESDHILPFQFHHQITWQNVTFTYPGARKPALTDINLVIPKGKILGITGKTGCGKTTMAQLLSCQSVPDSGKILFDDVPPLDISRSDFNRHIAYVPQDVFLFSDTLAGNIAFGVAEGEESEEKITEAAMMAGLGRDIAQFPLGLKTLLGERGVLLSGGQKQRVSIARAFIKDADLYIFDDCLSAVDADTEKEIIQSLTSKLEGKTAIIISHRLASLQAADHIILLNDGVIEEQGTFADLVKAGGSFTELHQLQGHGQ
ncbi:MAG: ABC transporter ATP-binding protein [Sphingomonadales bacterium]|nr:ABC transporter ATP-binding protein [Sphingomonadales bacterium]